jgi:3-demethoxyubiquinol 3-hydroxylase
MQELQSLDRLLRVDHAGEYGAVRLYQGQLWAMRARAAGDSGTLSHMLAQELRHRAALEQALLTHRVRPSALMPLWHVAGFALGAATAIMGHKAAMACTIAVEEVIDEHYAGHVEALHDTHPALAAQLEEFRQEEIEHQQTAIAEGGREALGYPLLRTFIQAGARAAIAIAARV